MKIGKYETKGNEKFNYVWWHWVIMFGALVVIVVIVGVNVRGLQNALNPNLGNNHGAVTANPRVNHFNNIYISPLPSAIDGDHLNMNQVHHIDNAFIRRYFINYVNYNISLRNLVHVVEGNNYLVAASIMDHRSRELFNTANLSGIFELNTSNQYVIPQTNNFGSSFTLVDVDETGEGINLIYRGMINTVPTTIKFNLTNHMGSHQVNYFQRISE